MKCFILYINIMLLCWVNPSLYTCYIENHYLAYHRQISMIRKKMNLSVTELFSFIPTMSRRFRVLISNPTAPQIALTTLSENCDVIVSPAHNKSDILKIIPGIDGLYWSGARVKIDEDVLEAAGRQLKVIGTCSTGYNHVDLVEVKRRGIKLGNCPDVSSRVVANRGVLLALAAASRITESRWHMEKGTWPREFHAQWMLAQDIDGATIGIIGLGSIGQEIARKLQVFDVARILYTGPREKPEGVNLRAQFVSLHTLIHESDFIFLSVPLNDQTKLMCDSNFFSKMKSTAILVNISRGEIVDQEALIKALKEGQIFAAGLDVMTPEPLNVDNELLKLPNLVLTPHTGSATKKTRDAMAEFTARNILKGLKGEELLAPVEF